MLNRAGLHTKYSAYSHKAQTAAIMVYAELFFTQYSTHSSHNVHPLDHITRLCGPITSVYKFTTITSNVVLSELLLFTIDPPVSNIKQSNMRITAVVFLLSAVMGANGENWSGVSNRAYLASYPQVIQGANTY